MLNQLKATYFLVANRVRLIDYTVSNVVLLVMNYGLVTYVLYLLVFEYRTSQDSRDWSWIYT